MKRINKMKVRILATALSAVMLTGLVPMMQVSAASSEPSNASLNIDPTHKYEGYDVIKGKYMDRFDFYYSDGYFTTDPFLYNASMATTSAQMAEATDTCSNGDDYSNGARYIKDMLNQMGFQDITENEDYKVKPTKDSIGCVIAEKEVNTGNGISKVISVTIRGLGYGMEWASNVWLGKDGEAAGFSEAADKVMAFLENYLASHPDVWEAVDRGTAAFWLQGYSRAGAAANLTAKRIIDKYNNSKVFAYCIAAPQGGTPQAEMSGRDWKEYTCIHNVINPDDMVPYVMPGGMGFMRYGVDHYVQDSGLYDNLHTDLNLFPNTAAENSPYKRLNETEMGKVTTQINRIFGNVEEAKKYYPYAAEGKRFGLSLSGYSIDKSDDFDGTPDINSGFFGQLTSGINRNTYVDSGLQDALSRIIQYSIDGGDIAGALNKIDMNDLVMHVLDKHWEDLLTVAKYIDKSDPESNLYSDFANIVTGDKNIKYFLDIPDSLAEKMAGTIANYLEAKSVFMQKFANYPGGSKMAISDIKVVVAKLLPNMKDADLTVSFVMNIQGLLRNHALPQYIGWLRYQDPLYNNTCLKNIFHFG